MLGSDAAGVDATIAAVRKAEPARRPAARAQPAVPPARRPAALVPLACGGDKHGPQARIGLHNDCFLADDTDVGTYPDGEPQRSYIRQLSAVTPFGGETCQPPDPAQARNSCADILREGAEYHVSYLGEDYYTPHLPRHLGSPGLPRHRAHPAGLPLRADPAWPTPPALPPASPSGCASSWSIGAGPGSTTPAPSSCCSATKTAGKSSGFRC